MLKSEKVKLVAVGFVFVLFTMTFSRFAYTLILPDMRRSLGFSNTLMGIFGMGIVIGYLINSFLSGRFSEIIGERKIAKISVLAASIALFSLGYFKNPVLLFIWFVILGAGASGSYIPIVSLINRKFSKKELVLGLIMGGTGVGITMTGYIIPPIIEFENGALSGYRMVWLLLSGVNFLAFILSLFMLKEEKGSKEFNFKRRSKNETRIVTLFITNKALLLTVLIYTILGFGYIIYSTFFGDYSISEIGFSPKTTGYMWSLFGINTIYSGILWGFFAEKGKKVTAGLVVNSLIAVSVILIIVSKAKFVFYLSTFLFGLSFMGFIVVIMSLISSEVEPSKMAIAFGAGTFMHGAGQIIGTFISGLLKDATGTFRVPFVISFISFGISLYLFIKLGRYFREKNNGVDFSVGFSSEEQVIKDAE